MTIGVDATYSLGPNLSGVGVYSREILNELARLHPEAQWLRYYRWPRYRQSFSTTSQAARRLLLDSVGFRSADLFHGLNQRLPKKRFRRQIATFHDLFVMTGEYSTVEFRERFTRQARQAAAGADHIIAVSEFTAGQVHELLGVPRAAISVIPHGVTPLAIPDLPREKIVLSVGAIQARKNISRLLSAFRVLPPEWRLVLAGSSGFGSQKIVDEIAASPVRDRIQVTGYIDSEELATWYARATIFAFPSLDEGFGIPVLEAMAAGVPVMASNRSALPEVCGDAAILVDPKSEVEIAEALRELAASPELRQTLICKGLQRIRQFTWTRAARSTWHVYESVLKGT